MEGNLIIAYILLFVSAAVMLTGLAFLVFKREHKLWWFSGFVLATVLLLQISLNVAYPYDFSSDGKDKISFAAIVVRVLSYSFQSFSLDLGYTEILSVGELAFYSQDIAFTAWGVYVFDVLMCAMTFIAPTTGGFAVFGLLLHFFPYLKLFFSAKSTKFIFSELNESSIETAESIFRKKEFLRKFKNRNLRKAYGKEEWRRLKSSVIIFMDVYTDASEENSSELFERAKRIGAICIHDDVTECKTFWLWPFIRRKRAVYFLIDANYESNLKAAVALLSPNKRKNAWIKTHWWQLWTKTDNIELYVFTQNTESGNIITSACAELKNKISGLNVVYKVINEYRNLVYRLIDGYAKGVGSDYPAKNGYERTFPLYYSLLKDTDDGEDIDLSKLSVVIVGGGRIGREFFKAAYWCGQMLASTEPQKGKQAYAPTKLKITVISQDASESEKKLIFDMPEAFDKKYSDYCEFNFIEAEFGYSGSGDGGFENKFGRYCSDADYVLVALGNDDLNIQAANWIKRTLDRFNLASPRRIPVNYVIENRDLCRSMALSSDGSGNGGKAQGNADRGCILHPFGSLTQRFDCDNIYLNGLEQRAWNIDLVHGSESSKAEFVSDEYSRNSSIATVIHYTYKLVSIGAIRSRDFFLNGYGDEVDCGKYVSQLYWIEHRRWCAYIRSTGWRCPTAKQFCAYAFDGSLNFKTHKNANLMMHACLVESGVTVYDKQYIRRKFAGGREEILAAVKDCREGENDAPLDEWLDENFALSDERLDALDKLTLLVSTFKDTDFKAYDVNTVTNLYRDDVKLKLFSIIADGYTDGSASREICRLLNSYIGDSSELIKSDGFTLAKVAVIKNYCIVAGKVSEGVACRCLENAGRSRDCKVYDLRNASDSLIAPRRGRKLIVLTQDDCILAAFPENGSLCLAEGVDNSVCTEISLDGKKNLKITKNVISAS